MSDNVNDTLVQMVRNLKPKVEVADSPHFSFSASLKRTWTQKSESLSGGDHATPLKKMKPDPTMDLNYIGSPREMRRLRADLLEARNTILTLESRIQHMHNVRKEMEVMYDNETKLLKQQREHDRKTIEELESQLQTVRKRELELKDQVAEADARYNLFKIKKDEEIEELEKSICEIKEESRVLDDEENGDIVALNRRIGELQMMLDAAEDDAEAQKNLARELEKQLSERNHYERELEKKDAALQAALLQIKDLKYSKDTYLEVQEQARTQSHKLRKYPDMEKEIAQLQEENTRLKDEVRNKLILEEEVHDLKGRLVTFKEQEKKFAHLHVAQVQTEMYLDEWRSVARGICETTGSDSSLPHLLRTAVEKLQQQEISLTSAKVELESQLSDAVYEAKVAKADLEKTQKLLSDMRKTSEQKQNLFHRLQKKLTLVSRERDSYRQQLDSYEKDLTMTVNTSTVGGGGNNSQQVQSMRERIANLEKIVENYRELNAKYESDLQALNPDLYNSFPLGPGKNEVARMQEELERVKEQNEHLKQRRDQLEIQLEHLLEGHDTLHGGQVYHLANNPLAECVGEREARVLKLEQDNERLKKKIKNLEDGLEASKLNDTVISSQEVKALQEQIKSHESQTQKMKEYVKSSIQEFRNVVYMLMGYKIDRMQNSLYKLTSTYAESEEDYLCFQVDNDGLNLLENAFSASLDQLVNLHLKHQKSFPVFLSALTIDLFNSSTMAT